MNRRLALGLALGAPALAMLPAMALAQAYPSKPVTVTVPFAVGGGSDNVARMVTTKLTERTGKSFVIDNRGGGGTNIGNEAASRATPDGYTFLLGQFTLSVNPHLYSGLRYDADKSFVPVVHIADAPTVLIVPASSPMKTVADVVAAAKARPGKLNFGSGGSGTSVHLAGELFKLQNKVDLVHIPYKGSAPAMTDLIGGQIEMMFDTSTSALPHIKGGKVRAVGVAAGQRLKDLPGVPTFAEQGFKDFDVPAWYGFVAPKGTPAEAVQWLNAEVNAVLKDPSVVAKLDAVGAVAVGGTPAQMGDFMKAQSGRWAKVVKDAGIKLD
ncbi:Bug family tripartite tricarboxylate transporter substrate binding protein [Azohydromonas lata]|uniref:Tripartite tricarboxylate transporter substrate binding protein n=1 Tax=Azohydromonas lata TaxID=45677 RepID=A0ABU5IH29_9BURK|nr:tripartite tricarboxylate transporter substrate binding protein [Azohydromonas lata]MDZ5458446.1 tripartite tricarboxylate transporter substrate binding protein [Azohydromonas lata]